ncbi:MAG: hypothetical protein R3Y43_05160 [Alphaproteobacteria bacterium]
MSELPQFISEKSESNYSVDAPEIKTSWASQNIYKLMMWFSVIWFLIVLTYITKYFGWSNLFLMMPDEFGGFLAGVTLPLGAIWVVMAYIDRGTNFKNEAKFLRAYLNQLVYPEEGGAQTTKAMADAIRSQVIELQEVTKEANAQSLNIKKGLEVKIDEFSKLVGILDTYSSKTMQEFSGRVDGLIKNFDYVNTASSNAADGLKSTLEDFSEISHTISTDLNNIFSSLVPQIQQLKTASSELSAINEDNLSKMDASNKVLNDFADKTVSSVDFVSKRLLDQTSKIQETSFDIISKVEDMQTSLGGSVKDFGKILDAQSSFVSSHIKEFDKANDNLSKKLSAQGDVVASEVEKVITRSSFVAETIETQVNNLHSVADSIGSDMETIVTSLSDSTAVFDEKYAKVAANLNNGIDAISDGALKVEEIVAKSSSSIDSLSGSLQVKSTDWNSALLDIFQKYDALYKDITDKTKDLKFISNQTVDDIKEVGGVMDKYANNLTQTCSLVVAQNKQSEVSLNQQHKNLNTSISSLEFARSEIKKQVEELSKSAVVINEEAVSAINNLKSQMEDALQTSEDVVTKTRVINESLKEQSKDFDVSTTKTLSSMKEFSSTLSDNYKELNKLSSNVDERSASVSNTLEKQINMLDERTELSSKKYEGILSLFTEQTNVLNSVTEKTVSYVADVVSSLDEKAEVINALFQHQEEAFLSVCDKLSENTSNIASSLRKHILSIEQSTDKAFSRMTTLEADVNKRSTLVCNIATSSMDKITDIQKHLEEKSEEAVNSVSKVEEKFLLTADVISGRLNNFETSIQSLDDLSGEVNNKISEKAKSLLDVNQKIVAETNNSCDFLSSKNTYLEGFLAKVQAQAETLKDVFDTQKETLTEVANVVATQSRLGESSLSQQYKILSDASLEVSQKMNEIQDKFKNNMEFVSDTSAKIAYEIDTLGDRLITISEDVETSSKSVIKDIQSVSLNLSDCEENLLKSAKKSSETLGQAAGSYEQYIANFNTVTAEASTGVFEINSLISDQSDKMIKISEDTKELVACFNTVLNDTSLELSNRANFAFEKVKGLGENLKTLSNQLEDAGKLGAKHLETSGDKLRAQINEITANAERISNSILGSGETFLKQSDVLVVTTDDALIKVNNIMDKLDEGSKSFLSIGDVTTQKAASFSALVETQVKSLTEVASKADSKLKELLTVHDNVSTDKFIKDSAYIIETLETLAVDVAKLINPENAEEMWKKYYNGDNSVFIRNLAKNLNKNQVATIKGRYESDAEFRKIITRYLTEFEELLNKAQNNERAGIILSVITSADIGKVYYVLAKALDKLN